MENKRYQVFVSSTYTDLTAARQAVLLTLLTMDCLPAGMELFGAVDEEQFEFIKRVIDDSDYYVLIIGGRYGTVAADGKSYTEKEYDYAVATGKKVLAFVHESPDTLQAKDYEDTPEGRDRLKAFQAKVDKGRLRTTWKTQDDLAGKVAVALQKTIKLHPAVGWVRADTIANVTALNELNELRKENDRLKGMALRVPEISDIAGHEEKVGICGWQGQTRERWQSYPTWQEVLSAVLPNLIARRHEGFVGDLLAQRFCPGLRVNVSIEAQCVQNVKMQLMALNAIDVVPEELESGDGVLYWKITPTGRQIMLEAGVHRTDSP